MSEQITLVWTVAIRSAVTASMAAHPALMNLCPCMNEANSVAKVPICPSAEPKPQWRMAGKRQQDPGRKPPEQAPCRLACTPKERTQAMKRYIDRACQSLEENRRVTGEQPGEGKRRGKTRRHAAAAARLRADQRFRPARNSARVSGWVLNTPPREVVVV